MDKNRHAACSLPIAVTALAGIALLTPAPASAGAKGRQEKLQKRIDQLAAQMHAKQYIHLISYDDYNKYRQAVAR